ncbi:hypothetical protein MKX01_004927 [Papaver californicum]|nr:hypothetical protein MKX01_004927 [Papaver californicum]
MATSCRASMTRVERQKQYYLEEGRKAGIIPPAVDKHGKIINPNIPKYILDHQKKQKPEPNKLLLVLPSSSFPRGEKTYQADLYRKGTCVNCGAKIHTAKACMERPREKKGKHINMFISPDEKIYQITSSSELDYDAKRDRWNGYDLARYAHNTKIYEAREEARNKSKIKKLEETTTLDEAEVVDDSKQMDFAKVEKRVRTIAGSTGTVRNLRIREDTAKYLHNLDLESAYYDPKTRSMRENPNPNSDPNENFYVGDNQNRETEQALEFKNLIVYAWKSSDKGHDVHLQAAPSQAELLYKSFNYGSAANEEDIPRELLLGQSEIQVEHDRSGRIIKGHQMVFPRSKYEEGLCINNHTTVCCSWWRDHQWGYKCCKQVIRNSYCTGIAGTEAAEAATVLMKANVFRKETNQDPAPAEQNKLKLASWGTDLPEDLRDERKRKYNVKWNDEVTAEDMEAFRKKKVHHDDPMKDFLNCPSIQTV